MWKGGGAVISFNTYYNNNNNIMFIMHDENCMYYTLDLGFIVI